jgi:hypothetical protein
MKRKDFEFFEKNTPAFRQTTIIEQLREITRLLGGIFLILLLIYLIIILK